MFVFLVLNEATLPILMWRAAWRLPTCIVHIEAIAPRVSSLLERFAHWLHKRGRVDLLENSHPELIPFTDINDVHRFTDTFRLTESWQESYYRYAEADKRLGGYAYPWRDLTGNFLQRKLLYLFRLRTVAQSGISKGLRFLGVSRDMKALYRSRFQEDLDQRQATGALWRLPLNAAITLLALIHLYVWVLRRLRPGQKPERQFFLGSDFVNDPRDAIFLRELNDAPEPLLIVLRNKGQISQAAAFSGPWQRCLSGDGRFGVASGLMALLEGTIDLARLFAFAHSTNCELFRLLALLPYRRLMFRALFIRFPCRYFWGRDDYNVEHMLRSQELRSANGTSIGISHGLHVVSLVLQQTRYVDYDLYYVFGEALCRRYLAAKWPAAMRLRNISSFALDRERLRSFSTLRPNNVACILVPSKSAGASFKAVLELAAAFPDRKVFVTVKSKYIVGSYGLAFSAFLADAPDNVVYYPALPPTSTYDLFDRARYIVSDPTTMLGEAIHLGLYAWALDLDPDWQQLTLREIPGLCVRSASEAIAWIRDIESGARDYDRCAFAGDIELTGKVVWDIFRQDMGLPAREALMPHLSFCSERNVS